MTDRRREFSNHVGQELYQVLARRSAEQLADQPDLERHTSMLGAALIPVAEVLRQQIEEGTDPERLLNLTTRWLRVFLDPVSGKRQSGN